LAQAIVNLHQQPLIAKRYASALQKEIQEEFNNLIVESNKKLQEARDAVTEAHKTLAEIITKILKVYNGKLPETTPEDIASQAEAEESAEAGVEA